MSIYQLKPRFQALLRPFVGLLFRAGVTANQVTLLACAISVALGVWLYAVQVPRWCFLLVPAWMFVRMALNAIDGMLARDFGQQSVLGAYLNELTDVIADAALLLPLVVIMPASAVWVAVIAVLAALTELAGVLGQTVGASRRYDGPMGKSDRAVVIGALCLWAGLGGVGLGAVWGTWPAWTQWILPVVAFLTALTAYNRVRRGLIERAHNSSTHSM